MAGDATPGVGARDPGLATEGGDEGLIEIVAGDALGPQTEEERSRLARAPIEQERLGGTDGFPRVDRLADEGVDRLW
jgi:hypothetical protein